MKISTKQIGDGKLPNRFWLSICNDYYYNSGSNSYDWISDLKLFTCRSKELAVYKSYEEAKKAADEIYLGQEIDNITVNSIHIEDRLSGEVYEKARYFSPIDGKIWEDEHEDLSFSMKQEAALKGL